VHFAALEKCSCSCEFDAASYSVLLFEAQLEVSLPHQQWLPRSSPFPARNASYLTIFAGSPENGCSFTGSPAGGFMPGDRKIVREGRVEER
jgi:hypothetical protein